MDATLQEATKSLPEVPVYSRRWVLHCGTGFSLFTDLRPLGATVFAHNGPVCSGQAYSRGMWEPWMRLAIDEARAAAQDEDVPVGAIITDGEQVIATGRNLREVIQDPTAHAELVAIRNAAQHRGNWHLDGLTLVVTLEPCAMCAGAIVLSRLDRVVYGATDPKAGATRSLYNIADDPRLNHRADIVTGVLEDECGEILRSFFKERRLRAKAKKQSSAIPPQDG